MATDYRPTVFLPQTGFPMKGELPKREPQLLKRWQEMRLYERQRAALKGREKFILHDGPPYANGNLHIGHALNKILKDVVNRVQQKLGKDAVYVPGWDCHGLPIEWKIEEKYRVEKKNKDDVPIAQFRRECREFAEYWIDVQRDEFKRLGVEGDWEHPYLTMAPASEAQIVREIGKFLMNGGLYHGAKPVMWSVVERTALADAEVEYHDHTSTTAWVRFPVVKPSTPALAGAAVVIWTTTPWTLPGNRAIAYGPELKYSVIRPKMVGSHGPKLGAQQGGGNVQIGELLCVAESCVEDFAKVANILQHDVVATFLGTSLAGTVTRHPLRGQGYDFDVALYPGTFVTDTDGTGFVHIAPGHGVDDFELGHANGLEVPQTVAGDGTYYPHVPLFAGAVVYKPNGKPGDANERVLAAIDAAGGLLARSKLTHSYPHSWRSKAPLIFRNTPQWFISMETNSLRQNALQAIADTEWVPPAGENRIRSMIESRPDWCISRQRAWGVPIAVFTDKATGEPLRDQAVVDRIAEAIERGGSDIWFTADPASFLGNRYDPAKYQKVTDIVEVWFESGASHSYVLEKRADLRWPASLYLEGSDQHRGWFHSSLLESCGTRGRAPYDAVLTHGFVLDEQGRKMSKSLGNVVSPQEVVEKSGADILRLWVVASDYSEDLRIGPEILKYQGDVYRRLRNTLRYLLGNLAGFTERERVEPSQMPELERWVLHRLAETDALVRETSQSYAFHTMFTALHNLCAVDLSAFYFDVRKDVLYCDPPNSLRRRAARTVLDRTFDALARWLAPVLCFTAEEAWLARHGDSGEVSVHLELYPELPTAWRDDALGAKWARLRDLRRVVTGALEIERAQKRLGSSLQGAARLYVPEEYRAALPGVDLAELCITSEGTVAFAPPPASAFTLSDVPGVGAVIELAAGEKCQRCWRVLPEVGAADGHAELCRRCADAVAQLTPAGSA
ncbi:MAG TPA: isoleucine--tRNA ligase [Stellaceae bacterium]|nr:isoleucine--tRNA ligase [Stellaceae bacterium]